MYSSPSPVGLIDKLRQAGVVSNVLAVNNLSLILLLLVAPQMCLAVTGLH